ncbi:MAG: phosphatidylglycerophosphatase A [Gammaproteobacteria bacterium]|nr:phosphatidylglycerophosphatase A [Gammaproteobacteria bacterium]
MKKTLTKPSPTLLRNPVHFLSLGFGSGLVPVAPGTAGTVAAIPVYLLLNSLELTSYLIIVLISFVIGVYICGETSKALGVEDHPAIVWDEVVGYLITMILAPSGVLWVVTGFVLFRIFDILKPWPIRVLDRRLKGGMGIMLDDVLAGIFAALVLHFVVKPILI